MTRRGRAGVALVGAGGPDHWSGRAHIPAIRATDSLALLRLCTSREASAQAAEAGWGIPATHELERVLDDPAIDLVVVATGVPAHAGIVTRALAAGKHVYCEWPMVRDLEETRELANVAAQSPDSIVALGLQARQAGAVRAALAASEAGLIGRVLSFSVRLYVPLGLVERPAHRAHLRHRSAAADVLSIQAGHSLDVLGLLVGRLQPQWARVWCAVDEFRVAGTGERLARDAPDSLVAGFEAGGAWGVANISQAGAEPAFGLELLGTEGLLRLVGTGHPQFDPLALHVWSLDGEDVTPPVEVATFAGLDAQHPATNLAIAYGDLAQAILTGEASGLPGVDDGVELHELLTEIQQVGEEAEMTAGNTQTPR